MVADVALTTFGSSAAVVYAMQLLKKSNLPFVQEGRVALNRIVSVGAAALMQAGISWTWNPSTHSLIIGGLTLTAVMFAVWHIFCQYAMQEVVYQAAVNKPSSPTIAQQEIVKEEGAQTVAVSPKQATGL